VFCTVQSTVTTTVHTIVHTIENVYYPGMESWQCFNRSRVSNKSQVSNRSQNRSWMF